jgi:hypothetical protein
VHFSSKLLLLSCGFLKVSVECSKHLLLLLAGYLVDGPSFKAARAWGRVWQLSILVYIKEKVTVKGVLTIKVYH